MSIVALVAFCGFLATIPHASGRGLAIDPKPPGASSVSERDGQVLNPVREDLSSPAPAAGAGGEATGARARSTSPMTMHV